MSSWEFKHADLLDLADNAVENAYAPYSGFRVGAAALARNGKTYIGVNVENASYGLTICAERSAIFNAVSCGATQIKAIAVVADRDGHRVKVPPCGACRQVMFEFMTIYGEVILGPKSVIELRELLPMPFGVTDLR